MNRDESPARKKVAAKQAKVTKAPGSDVTIATRLGVEQVEELHEVFCREGSRGFSKSLQIRRFIDAVVDILTNPTAGGTPTTETSRQTAVTRQEVKRWAIAMATTSAVPNSNKSISDDGEESQVDERDKDDAMMRDKYVIRWSDLTTNMIRDEEQKDGLQEQNLEYRRVVAPTRSTHHQLHSCSPSIAITSPVSGKLITAGKDGLVKMWNPTNGAFEKNLYNAGFSWIMDISFLHGESMMIIATSNAHVAVVEFPSGNLVQQYVGSVKEDVAITSVVNRSIVHTQRFGMLPGDCGPRKIRFPNILEISQSEFTERQRVAREGPTSKVVDVKPIVGYVDITAFCNVAEQHVCAFGTSTGGIGIFDLSEDLRQTSLITGSTIRSIHPLYITPCHLSSVTAIRFTARTRSLFSVSLDGCLYRTCLDNGGDKPIRHNVGETELKPILGMDWSESQQVLATYTSDKRIKLWSPMRPEALHCFDALPHEILSLTIIANTEQFATITADKTLRIFDLRTFRCIQIIQQSLANEESTGTLDNNYLSILKVSIDVGGAVTYDKFHDQLVCALKAPVLYSTRTTYQNHAAPQPVAESATRPPVNLPQGGSSTEAFSPPEVVDVAPAEKITPTASHSSAPLDILYNKNTRLLFSIDTSTIFSWNIYNGECLNVVDIARQVQRMDLVNVNPRALRITKSSWLTSDSSRIVTGTQSAHIITWNATGSIALTVQHLSSAHKSSDISCLTTKGSILVASVCNRAHIFAWNPDRVLASGALHCDKHVTLDIPADSISSSMLIRDSTVVLGSIDAKLYFFDLVTQQSNEVLLVSESGNDEVSSIEEILFLNRTNQCCLLIFLENGEVLLFSVLERVILRRLRVFRSREARFTMAALSFAEDYFISGDSLGRIRVFKIMPGRSVPSSSTQLFEWSCTLKLSASIQVSYDPISSIRICDDIGCFVVGCDDSSMKLYQLEDSNSANTYVTVTHVGTFGQRSWNISDPSTFAREVLVKAQHVMEGETQLMGDEFIHDILQTAKTKKKMLENTFLKVDSPNKMMQTTVSAARTASREYSPRATTSDSPRGASRLNSQMQRPATVPTLDLTFTSRDPLDTLPSVGRGFTATQLQITDRSRSLSPRAPSQIGVPTSKGFPTFGRTDANVPIPAPPLYSSTQDIMSRLQGARLSVKKKVIDAPDLDLGNGMAAKASGYSVDGSASGAATPAAAVTPTRMQPTPSLTFITACESLDPPLLSNSSLTQSQSSHFLKASGGGGASCTTPSQRHGTLTASISLVPDDAALVWEDSMYEDAIVPPQQFDGEGLEAVATMPGFSSSDVDNARESTKNLLTQMALRLDLVCPSGYTQASFSKKLHKLYRTNDTPKAPPSASTAAKGSRAMPPMDPDLDEDEVAERFLANLRTPQTAKNVADMQDMIRQYKRNREVGGSKVENWITRVSSQLHVTKLQFAPPPAIASTTLQVTFPATARGIRPPVAPLPDRHAATPRGRKF